MPCIYPDLIEAIRDANSHAPCGIAYTDGGWTRYDLVNGTRDQPEFVALGHGHLPIPLTPVAVEALHSLVYKRTQR